MVRLIAWSDAKISRGVVGFRTLKCETGCFHDRYDNVLAPGRAGGG